MKRKVTEEEIKKFIAKMTEEITTEMNNNYHDARIEMLSAERELVNTLDKKQLDLYNEFAMKRELFYSIAKEKYEKKF